MNNSLDRERVRGRVLKDHIFGGFQFEDLTGDQRARKRRMIELAGRLKEKKSGTKTTLYKIMAKFSIEYGVKMDTVKDYLNLLKSNGLIIIKDGSQKWVYNTEAEWELFSVNI